jgi:hypothetical protein
MSDAEAPESDTDTRRVRYGIVDREYGLRLATTPPEEDGPVWMVNLMSYRERADYSVDDGAGGESARSGGEGEAVSGREADDRYTPLESLRSVGAEIVFVGDVETQPLGDSPKWDRVAVVKYPTRRAFIDMQARADFKKAHVHKDAGMAQTIIIGCQPFSPPPLPGAPDWKDVPHPPTEEDGPLMVVHVIRFVDEQQLQDMENYQSAAGAVAIPQGVRIAGWFRAEGTIVGDGRPWHQVRFNLFPSRQAFLAVAFDPSRMEAHREHRDTAIADTYTMMIRPRVNRIAESIAG